MMSQEQQQGRGAYCDDDLHHQNDDEQKEKAQQKRIPQKVSWAEILTESRRAFREKKQQQLQQCDKKTTHHDFVDTFGLYFPLLVQQLESYVDRMEGEESSSSTTSSSSKEEEKKQSMEQVILDTRNALRFGLSCLSFPTSNNDDADDANDDKASTTRQYVQNKAIGCDWHAGVCRLLSNSKSDIKCRLYAARLLTNLVTNNAASARAVVESIPLTPSTESISSRIRQDMLQQADLEENHQHNMSPATTHNNNSTCPSNWLDMLLASVRCCNKDRNVLAALVAALHNCIASLQVEVAAVAVVESMEEETLLLFHQQVARSNLIVSTLLRQVISAKSVMIPPNDNAAAAAAAAAAGEENDTTTTSSHADTATEWILLLLLQLVRLGLLPQLYRSAAGGGGGQANFGDSITDDTEATNTVTSNVVVPEQVVLLHCLIKGIEDEQHQSTSASNGGDLMVSIFGADPDHAIAAHLFLARIFVDVRCRCCLYDSGSSSGDASSHWWTATTESNGDRDFYALERSTLLTILDIMGETLSADTDCTRLVRSRVACPLTAPSTAMRTTTATTTTLLETILLDLGLILDELLVRNQATSSATTATTMSSSVRNFVMLESEQRAMIALVRVIGNLCHQCRQHQDLMRTTLVPSSTLNTTTTTTASATANTTTPRTGLHVLLSCTSFAHACFTLREWSIVAIRNVLHENFDNQAVVAELEAQQPIQSPTLESLGIRLDLESNSDRRQASGRSGSNQRVSVDPIPEDEQDRNQNKKHSTEDKA